MQSDKQRERAEKGEEIYSRFRKELEKDHMGEIAAIDLRAEKVVAVEKDIPRAFEAALRNSEEKVFYIKRVGHSSLGRV